jgi:methylated-DNA-[protein]-cysteine S-methyltransferase
MAWMACELEGFGRLYLAAAEDCLTAIRFDTPPPGEPELPGHPVLTQAARELVEYWAGERRVFTIPYEAEGTKFQCQVWEELTRIPYGETRSYAWIARALGNPQSVRAVGAANGANPLPIVIPCHRVLNSNGQLGGYGGGLSRKRALLEREGVASARPEAPLLAGL